MTDDTMSVDTSAASTPGGSPIQPLHNPSQAAQVHIPQAPLGNTTNALPPGFGAKALLAKKLATQGGNKAYVSPSDLLVTPCSAKLNQAKKKHFSKGKPIQFAIEASMEEESKPKDENDYVTPSV